jgi:RNA polymerase sigma-70 factor (ECF subfamily)
VQFTTWACRIAYFEVLAKRKRTSREKLTFLDESVLDSIAEQAVEVAELESDYLPLLRECMQELPPRSSELIESRYRAGGSVKSIAQTAGRSSGSIRVALHRIRAALFVCMERKVSAQA